jgi:hypothetical protein
VGEATKSGARRCLPSSRRAGCSPARSAWMRALVAVAAPIALRSDCRLSGSRPAGQSTLKAKGLEDRQGTTHAHDAIAAWFGSAHSKCHYAGRASPANQAQEDAGRHRGHRGQHPRHPARPRARKFEAVNRRASRWPGQKRAGKSSPAGRRLSSRRTAQDGGGVRCAAC